jgi:hypothetical protein
MRRLFGVSSDRTGNQPPLPSIFPDQLAPVVRTAKDGQREAISKDPSLLYGAHVEIGGEALYRAMCKRGHYRQTCRSALR